ncbi:hypothetical protein A9K55_003832 [Cordyceps militaris]|uniref:Uncharacterized protein n=1 Tax=Cordyceps militaris TaxID=73501 RepID=A0A2H4SMB3_CORMI|nr:hypothetical protein A9K55_003832 [Cordyceps militaris]
MCGGPETVHRPRGGALVALNPPPGIIAPAMTGDLTFHTPGQPDSTEATHARLSFDGVCGPPCALHVVIHAGGDLTKSASDCGLFRQLRLSARSSSEAWEEGCPLDTALSLQVGADGIIGRRVSVYGEEADGRSGRVVLAEGIVGYNSWPAERASL